MLAPLARCERVFITICATLSFFSFCQWDVRSSRATIADMLPSRSRNRALSSGMTNCRGTGPPRDLRTTTEFRLTLTEPLILEFVNDKKGRQSTIRQLPCSFLMIFLRRRQSMLETFMLTSRNGCYCLKNQSGLLLNAGSGQSVSPARVRAYISSKGIPADRFYVNETSLCNVTDHIWTPVTRPSI